MTSVQSKVFKSILFAAGLGIGVLAFFLFKPEQMLDSTIFMWVNIAVMYVVFFGPFFFAGIGLRDADSKITGYGIILGTEILFILVCLAFTILVPLQVIAVRVAVLAEAVLLFFAFIVVYLGAIAASKIQSVKADENSAMILITRIRSSMELLNMKASSLNDSYEEEKKKIAALTEDVKYITPVKDILGAKFEQEIMGKITAVSSQCDSVIAGSDGAELKKQLAVLESHIQQRKTMSN